MSKVITAEAFQKLYGKKTNTRPTSAAWREINGRKIYFRSKWEANYARYLEFLKANKNIADWEHEPETFWFEKIKRGVRSYLPDFKVTNLDGTHHWVEVKGYMDSRSATKIKRFAKYHPVQKLILIQGEWFSQNNKKLSAIIKNWE